jgi:hypothetical protein
LSIIVDVDLHHDFWEDLGAAENAAQKEAANTGAAVICVETIDIRAHEVSFIGTISESAIDREVAPGKKSVSLGRFHTTWGAVLSPTQLLGFLVVHHPISFTSCATEIADRRRVAVTLGRTFNTIPTSVLGAVRCRKCQQPISPARLRARPGVHLCTACQASNEETFYGNQRSCRQ